jgi:hypothetical protein
MQNRRPPLEPLYGHILEAAAAPAAADAPAASSASLTSPEVTRRHRPSAATAEQGGGGGAAPAMPRLDLDLVMQTPTKPTPAGGGDGGGGGEGGDGAPVPIMSPNGSRVSPFPDKRSKFTFDDAGGAGGGGHPLEYANIFAEPRPRPKHVRRSHRTSVSFSDQLGSLEGVRAWLPGGRTVLLWWWGPLVYVGRRVVVAVVGPRAVWCACVCQPPAAKG